MRNRSVTLMTAVMMVLFFSIAATGQQGTSSGAATIFDARDLAGFWRLDGGHTIGTRPPALTPAGVEAMKGRIPDSLNRLPGNAPYYECNPMGFPRIVNDNEPVEFIQLGDRLLQFFQWDHTLRELWLDSRELPSGDNLENLGPGWYGHSVGQWEGDTLVVQTVGLDERAWLDNQAYPKSFYARIEERLRRIDADTIELQMTLYDPAFYTATWIGSKKTYKRIPMNEYTYFEWKGLYSGITEAICAPVNEVEDYNKRFRDPAAGRVPAQP